MSAEPRVVREEIPQGLAGQRVDRVVAMLTGVSRAAALELVEAGAVLLDGAACRHRTHKVQVGDHIEVTVPDETAALAATGDASVDVAVVYVDADLVVVDKPAGLVVHPGSGNETGTLIQGLLARYPDIAVAGDPARPGVVHRIDKGTSGLLVVARSAAAYEGLVAQLGARTVERSYLTLVWGHLESTQGLIDAPIGRSQRDATRMTVSTRGREARTRYEVLEAFVDPAPLSLLACHLETGRTHQIRVHLSAIGHAVAGDPRYDGIRPSVPLRRPFLHAAELGFDHPVTGEHLTFRSPLPADLEAVLADLRGRGGVVEG